MAAPTHANEGRASARGVLRLRNLLLGGFLLAAVSLVVTAVMLGLLSTYLQRAASNLGQAVDSIKVGEELEVEVMTHNRLASLPDAPPTGYAPSLTQVESEIRRRLGEARRYVTNGEEEALLLRARAQVEEYLATEKTTRGRSLDERLRLNGPKLDAALATIEALIDVNVEQARLERLRAHRWDRIVSTIAIFIVALTLLAIGPVTLAFRSLVDRPLGSLHGAMSRFAGGDKHARAEEQGPIDLREVARTFNDMATALEHQEQQHLAFLGGVAHDIRQPLTAIMLTTDVVVRSEDSTSGTMQQATVTLRRQVQRLERMVGDFLDATRIQAGRLELRLEPTDLRLLVAEVVETYRPFSPQHTFESSLPAAPIVARCDPARLAQVLNNLVSNAVKYSPRGGRISVLLEHDHDLEEAIIAVTDEGVGIDDSDLEGIFEPFRRTGMSRELVPGVGLGLSITRRIVEVHGGRMDVTSVPGRGSTFRVHLPLAGVPESPEPGAPPKPGAPRPAQEFSTVT